MALAFLAGLISFLSPCVLPLIPVYLAYLAGTSIDEVRSGAGRRPALIHSGFFILGFSLVFIALGASASALGGLLFQYRSFLERTGGAVLVLLGFWMMGIVKADMLYREARFHFAGKPAGYFGSILVGAAFAAGWTPCVGPVLAGILLLASRSGSVAHGILLLSVYSLGFALPLLACALALGRAIGLLNRIKPALPAIERGTGVCLILLGILLAGGWYQRASTWSLSYFPGWAGLFGKLGL